MVGPQKKTRQQLLQAYRQRHFEETTTLESQEVSVPKADKVLEWALLEIVDLLTSINSNLSKLASRP